MQYLWRYSCKDFKKSVSVSVILSVRWDTFKVLMTFAALIRIYSIVYPSQYEKLQALQKIAKKKKKKSIFCKFLFFNTFGALNKEQNSSDFKYGFVEYGVSKWQ